MRMSFKKCAYGRTDANFLNPFDQRLSETRVSAGLPISLAPQNVQAFSTPRSLAGWGIAACVSIHEASPAIGRDRLTAAQRTGVALHDWILTRRLASLRGQSVTGLRETTLGPGFRRTQGEVARISALLAYGCRLAVSATTFIGEVG